MRPSTACAKPFHAVAPGDIETWTLELPPDRASRLRKRQRLALIGGRASRHKPGFDSMTLPLWTGLAAAA